MDDREITISYQMIFYTNNLGIVVIAQVKFI